MQIALFIPTYNEAYTLDQVLSYYRANGVTDIFVFDNYSKDETTKIAYQHKANVFRSVTSDLDDRNYLHIKNEAWKFYRNDYDFIIACDADEVLYHPEGLATALAKETASVIHPIGWNVYSDLNPDPIDILKINTGFHDPNFSKCVCFNPKRIDEMNYGWGAHSCNPKGDVVFNTNEYYLLHVRCLGGVQRMIDRHQAYAERMSEFNRTRGYGFHYLRSEEAIRQEWTLNMTKAMEATFIRR